MFSINENEYTHMTDEKLIENIKQEDQKALDYAMIEADGTETKSNLGLALNSADELRQFKVSKKNRKFSEPAIFPL